MRLAWHLRAGLRVDFQCGFPDQRSQYTRSEKAAPGWRDYVFIIEMHRGWGGVCRTVGFRDLISMTCLSAEASSDVKNLFCARQGRLEYCIKGED